MLPPIVRKKGRFAGSTQSDEVKKKVPKKVFKTAGIKGEKGQPEAGDQKRAKGRLKGENSRNRAQTQVEREHNPK